MGFFSELKSDLSQAVNTILPEEEPQEEVAPAADAGGKVDLGEMLDHLDDIKLDEHLVAEEPQETVAEEPLQQESQEKPAEDLSAQAELAQAVQEIQAEEPAPAVQETVAEEVAESFPEPAAVEPDGWEEIRTTADLKEETTEALAATLGAIEEISRNRVEEQMAAEAEREVEARRAEERKKRNIGGM
ncbi:MAG: hypothetical protein IJT34_08355, partial [Butyrivibrio sp.]|nr:hypothetical protein [Butyrivibrio sp.]